MGRRLRGRKSGLGLLILSLKNPPLREDPPPWDPHPSLLLTHHSQGLGQEHFIELSLALLSGYLLACCE